MYSTCSLLSCHVTKILITSKSSYSQHCSWTVLTQYSVTAPPLPLPQADHEENLRREKIAEARKLRREKIDEEMKDFSDEESNSSNTDSRTGTPQLNVQSNVSSSYNFI